MKLDRDINPDGKGKYALIKLRLLPERPRDAAHLVEMLASHLNAVEFGEPGTPGEFFPIMLKDKIAQAGLHAYAVEASADDIEYAAAVDRLAERAGPASPYCKRPD